MIIITNDNFFREKKLDESLLSYGAMARYRLCAMSCNQQSKPHVTESCKKAYLQNEDVPNGRYIDMYI